MEHRAYPKLPSSLADATGSGPRWVATEKIHGAQLVVATDGEHVQFGKRKAWLAAEDPFFGWQLLRNELELAVRACHTELGCARLYLYGELFGGHYPHVDIASLPGSSAVQTGIWYAPDLHFAVFDMLVFETDSDSDTGLFLAHSQLESLAANAELLSVPVLGWGTRRELVELPVRYQTHVPERLGLPPLADNLAEGYVLKPDVTLPPRDRAVVKHKIAEFDDNRFDESMAFDANAYLSVVELLRWATVMVNPMRLASARSKVGELASAVLDEVVLDVWIDLEAIFPRRMRALDEAEQGQLRAGLFELGDAALEAVNDRRPSHPGRGR